MIKIGHSLGGALAELDALYFTLNLPTDTSVKGMTYGTPRVGNVEFAHFFDAKASLFQKFICKYWIYSNARSLTSNVSIMREVSYLFAKIGRSSGCMCYISDFFPILPPQALGFLHPHGEIHIISPGNAVACSGQLRFYVKCSSQSFIVIGNDDAVDSQCQIQTVPNILEGNLLNHVSRIIIGQKFCTLLKRG